MPKIFLIEDHDQALKIWRKNKVKHLDLVHLDAHIDFGFYFAKPLRQAFFEARTTRELKTSLERSLAYQAYEKDFEKQVDMGNYIYPAIQEGIVRDFYWVVPGGRKEFQESMKFIKNLIRNLSNLEKDRTRLRLQSCDWRPQEGIISTRILGRKLVICILEKLPILKHAVLLDIDTDFLVIDSLRRSSNSDRIGQRKPWISPEELVAVLKRKIKNTPMATIAYSVNGGYTPIKYKHLGDQIAYCLSPYKFKTRLKNNYQAAAYFQLFNLTAKKQFYQKAIALNLSYRVRDNNYGPLYLAQRKFTYARNEFCRVLAADRNNPACLLGLGDIALENRDFPRAKKLFSRALKVKSNGLFSKARNQAILGLANIEFRLKNFPTAKELLFRYRAQEALEPQSYFLLGRIMEGEKRFSQAADLYKDAICLGFPGLKPLWRLALISTRLKNKAEMIKYINARYREFKKVFRKRKKINSSLSKAKAWRNIHQQMLSLEKRLSSYNLKIEGGGLK